MLLMCWWPIDFFCSGCTIFQGIASYHESSINLFQNKSDNNEIVFLERELLFYHDRFFNDPSAIPFQSTASSPAVYSFLLVNPYFPHYGVLFFQ